MLLKNTGLVFGTVIPASILLFVDLNGSQQTTRMAAVAVMMSIFWITEAVPLAATALLPLVLFPILGIASSKTTAVQYMNSTVFLLLGGFMIALAIQRWHLHRRIALNVLDLFGGQPARLLPGFIAATAVLSMWISNTASTLVMLPIALAIAARYEQELTEQQRQRLAVGLLLCIAYSASIGGMMTLVGTAPNLVFARNYEAMTGTSVGFAQWMTIALPFGIVMLLVLSFLLNKVYFRKLPHIESLQGVIHEEKQHLGMMRFEEKAVLLVFLVTALLWITRKGVDIGGFSLQGWSAQFAFGDLIDDGSVAVTMATLLFFLPARHRNGIRTTVLDAEVFAQLPWSVVLLFGGGFVLAFGFSESGLSGYLAGQLQGLQSFSMPLIITAVTAGMTFLTELTSNTATTQMVLPILQSAASVLDISPVWLMLPATLAASCAFMFPVATPPNAIVFGSGKVKMRDMLLVGFLLNTAAITLISLFSLWLLPLLFEVQ